MKKGIFYYVLAILEGVVSGVCFYHARREDDARRKAFLFIASAGWFALSVLDGLTGGRELRSACETACPEEAEETDL